MIFRLMDDEILFPDPALAEPDGLLAIGGDLRPERLMSAYRQGIFPWFSEGDPILWYAPHERCVIFPDRIKVSKSMRKVLQQEIFQVTVDQAFDDVIRQCAKICRSGQEGTWITAAMQEAYITLHRLGHGHSVEVWQDGQLVGGLYGIKVNDIFCGESMFSKVSNASKVALVHLAKHMDIKLIDCQLPNGHLMSMGAEMIGAREFISMLNA